VSVTQYRDDGFVPEAMINYLARLGWSHGDEELFSTEQLIGWFDLAHISRSPARFNAEKLAWLNQQYMKAADNARLAELAKPFLAADGCDPGAGPDLVRVVGLLKERVSTIKELADAAVYFYRPIEPPDALRQQHLSAELRAPLVALRERLQVADWTREQINGVVKQVVAEFKLKLPKLAMPLRVMVTGTAQTPSIDAVLELIGREEVVRRMDDALARFPGAADR